MGNGKSKCKLLHYWKLHDDHTGLCGMYYPNRAGSNGKGNGQSNGNWDVTWSKLLVSPLMTLLWSPRIRYITPLLRGLTLAYIGLRGSVKMGGTFLEVYGLRFRVIYSSGFYLGGPPHV